MDYSKNSLYQSNKIITEGLTFDDVLLLPDYSEILPHETDVSTTLAEGFFLKTPLISAAMDTVTEHAVAMVMARLGGLGIIHKNMTPEEQAEEVRLVKRSESGVVGKPFTLSPTDSVQDAKNLMKIQNISGLPVVENGLLVGLVTGRDVHFEDLANTTPVAQIMTPRDKLIVLGEHAKDTQTEEQLFAHAKELMHTHRIKKLPVIDKENRLVGLITRRDLQNATKYPLASKDVNGRLRVGAAIGVTPFDLETRAPALVSAGVDVLVVDTAHGHSAGVIAAVARVKREYGHLLKIVAGNIATGEAALALANAGADAVKVGIGPGSICTTRIVAGIGVPQVSAIFNVAQALAHTRVKIIADGGIKYSGDVVKALAAGAHTVMLGSLFAGCEESPGERVTLQGKVFKRYRGMGSLGAMRQGSKDRYFQGTQSDNNKLVPEGIEGQVPYRGPLAEVVHQLVGGLRSGMGYVGAPNVPVLQEKSKFVRITQAGLRESHVHDVNITEEAPNYSQSRG